MCLYIPPILEKLIRTASYTNLLVEIVKYLAKPPLFNIWTYIEGVEDALALKRVYMPLRIILLIVTIRGKGGLRAKGKGARGDVR